VAKHHPVRLVFVLVPALAFALVADLVMFVLQVPRREAWLVVAMVFAIACHAGWQLTEFDGRG
jgi:hypothetical protein